MVYIIILHTITSLTHVSYFCVLKISGGVAFGIIIFSLNQYGILGFTLKCFDSPFTYQNPTWWEEPLDRFSTPTCFSFMGMVLASPKDYSPGMPCSFCMMESSSDPCFISIQPALYYFPVPRLTSPLPSGLWHEYLSIETNYLLYPSLSAFPYDYS